MPTSQFGRRKLFIGAGVLALATACSGRSHSGTAAPTVATTYGPVRGVTRPTGLAFLGIPYAQALVGDLRFDVPNQPTPWHEPLDCTKYGPTAQRKQLSDVAFVPEPSIPGDTILTVNVFTPDIADNRRPVLVWIHGGGYVAGSPASPWYDGAAFNRDGVVVVSIGYRLGIEGFLHLDDAPDNRGILDCVAALKWVRDNIIAFGGDPERVTVAGQSAGGGMLWSLMCTPAAKGLFRAGILQSGALIQPNDRAIALAMSELFTKRTGLPATSEALRDLSRDQIQGLQDTLRAAGPDDPPWLFFGLAPWADGTVISQPSSELRKFAAAVEVPLMLGFTRDELRGTSLLGDYSSATDATLQVVLAELGFDPASSEAFKAAYPGLSAADLSSQAQNDALLRAPAYRMAEERAGRNQPTWLYEFAWESQAPDYRGRAVHCLDIPFAFDLLGAEGVAAVAGGNPPQSLANEMHKSWVSFISAADPGPAWPRFTLGRSEVMVWSNEPNVESDPFVTQRSIWPR